MEGQRHHRIMMRRLKQLRQLCVDDLTPKVRGPTVSGMRGSFPRLCSRARKNRLMSAAHIRRYQTATDRYSSFAHNSASS